MNVAGVVVEYNPFHNGHLYHLQETKKQTHADLLIAVMSGNFLQRGEPALLSKWTRTKLALQAGVDLVIELPYAYATQKAEVFAWGSVALLDSLGTTHLCFGSEEGSIEPFMETLDALHEHAPTFQRLLKKNLQTGCSYPKASALAFEQLQLTDTGLVDLSKPNNILGYHYVEAVQKLNSHIQAVTIQRKQAGYHDSEINTTSIASATAIRKSLFEHKGSDPMRSLQAQTPSYTAEALSIAGHHNMLRRWEDYFPFLKYRLLTDSLEVLNHIYEAEEGLENRLKKSISKANSFADFMTAIKTKRYTWTRLQRLCTHILTGASKSEMNDALVKKIPPYIRLLGMSGDGQDYLNTIKKTTQVPIITKSAKENVPMLDLDIRAADCYQLIGAENEPNEFERMPIRYNRDTHTFSKNQ